MNRLGRCACFRTAALLASLSVAIPAHADDALKIGAAVTGTVHRIDGGLMS